jgi:hypothetical protein
MYWRRSMNSKMATIPGRASEHLARRMSAVSRALTCRFPPTTRGMHSFTFQLIVSAFYVTVGALGDCFGGVKGVAGVIRVY